MAARMILLAIVAAFIIGALTLYVAQVTAGFGMAERPDRAGCEPAEPRQLGLALP